MESTNKTATILRDENNSIIVDDDRHVTCTCEDGLTFKIPVDLMDFDCETLRWNVDGTDIDVALRYNDPSEANPENCQNTASDMPVPENLDNATFGWTDASTKLLLSLYKEKKDLVASGKIRTYKLMWKSISEELLKFDYRASATQVENKFKTMKRAYKNMVSVNKNTGRGRTRCSFYSELTELLENEHSTAPLAVSGSAGLLIRLDTKPSYNTQSINRSQSTLNKPSTSLGTSTAHASSISANLVTISDSLNSASTSPGLKSIAFNNRGQRTGSQIDATATSLAQCKEAIKNLTKEIKEQRAHREQIQLQILAEQRKIVKLNQELIEAAKTQREFANRQRSEKNQLLRQVIELLKAQKTDK